MLKSASPAPSVPQERQLVCGYRDLTQKEFTEWYEPEIRRFAESLLIYLAFEKSATPETCGFAVCNRTAFDRKVLKLLDEMCRKGTIPQDAFDDGSDWARGHKASDYLFPPRFVTVYQWKNGFDATKINKDFTICPGEFDDVWTMYAKMVDETTGDIVFLRRDDYHGVIGDVVLRRKEVMPAK